MTRLSLSLINPFKEMTIVTKVANLWSRFLERIRGSKSYRKIGDPYKDTPLIPSHKPLANNGFSVVVINERRKPKQYDMSSNRFRIGLAGTAIIVCLAVFGVYSAFQGLWGYSSFTAGVHTKGIADVANLQQQSQDQASALSTSQKGYSGSAGSGSRVQESGSYGNKKGSDVTDSSDQDSHADSASSSLQSSEKLEGDLTSGLRKPQPQTGAGSMARSALDDGSGGASTSARVQAIGTQRDGGASPIVNFNAQDVTVKSGGPNSGTLSFRLIKDHSDIMFSGYLFVFVEMQDKRGETKIYVYPDKTNLGEGDLPSDFREGENISFKYNSRVELPYGDIRPGAGLARVSILLYGDNGKIVFQRGFEKKELIVAGGSGPQRMEGSKPKPTEKRRAL